MMVALHDQHPGYNWRSNKGYGTPEHYAGLKAHGITVHHRRSFAPIYHILYGDELQAGPLASVTQDTGVTSIDYND
jgi:ribonuclease HII